MSENVVALPGFAVPTPKGEPVQGVVDLLTEMLELAQAGQLRAVGVAYVIDDGAPTPITGRNFCGSGLSAPLEVSARRLWQAVCKWSDE